MSAAASPPREGRESHSAFHFTTPSTGGRAHAGAFAAHFVEVHVDPDFGTIRVARVVSAVDGGRILNPKTARSQIIGASPWESGWRCWRKPCRTVLAVW
jgi:CO/xanthine dehydrogenase Mo-binding subunit